MGGVKSTGVWKSFLLSYILPVIGGLIVYFRNKDKNKELVSICLVLSIFHPITFGFIMGVIIGLLIGLVAVLGGIEVEIAKVLAEKYATILWVPIELVSALIFMRIFRENKYRYFIPVWYFGLFGAIYSYYWGYKKEKALQADVSWFFIGYLLTSIFIDPLILGFLGDLASSPVEHQTSINTTEATAISIPLKSYENKTIQIISGSYYPYSIYLKENQTVRFAVNVSGGIINTVLLNSTEYDKLAEGGSEIYYFISGYRSGVEETIITFKAPYDDRYYLVLANTPILKGQAESLGNVEVRLEVYVSEV